MAEARADISTDALAPVDCRPLLQSRDLRRLFVVAFVAALLSKSGTLLSGMAPDDYVFAVDPIPRSVIAVMVAQGRGLNALMAMALQPLHAPLASIGTFAFVLACATIAFAVAVSIRLIQNARTNRIHDYAACAFSATHPYLTSYFLFRMNLLNMALIYVALAFALLILAYRRHAWQLAACAVLLAVFCQLSQIIVPLFAVAAGAWSLNRFCQARASGESLRVAADGIIAAVVVLIAALALYAVSSAVLRAALHIQPLLLYTPHLSHGFLGALGTAFKLVREVLFTQESIDPNWLKIWVLLVILAAVGVCLVCKPLRGVAALVLLIGGLLASVSPLALSWGGLVPRAFSPVGLCLALVFCLAFDAIPVRVSHAVAGALVVPLICFCLIGASLFYQQSVLARWDQDTAAAIVERAWPGPVSGLPIRLVAAWPAHLQRLGYGGSGVNESAFLYDWAYAGLFKVATGNPVNVIAGDPLACEETPAWPDAASTRRLPDGSTLVCMVHGSTAKVRRNYPTTAEESSFKLAYPLFLSYGPDSARITPFFPGTSARPVAVNLSPNHDGYSLRAEGADCDFPVDYTLTAADGAPLASGSYVRGVSHLTGTKIGSMVLSFRMATVAANNYGCNIVVSAGAGTS